MRKRFFTYLILIVGLALILFVKHLTDAQGLPAIESNIDKQLGNLASQSPNLRGLVVGRKGRVRMVGDAPPFKGEIQYQAQLNSSAADLFVYWAGDSTNSKITKIGLAINNSAPKILYTNNSN